MKATAEKEEKTNHNLNPESTFLELTSLEKKEKNNPRFRVRKGRRGKKERGYFFVASGGW